MSISRDTRPGLAQARLGLLVGVAAVSFAAIFIRLANAPPLVVAAYRLSIAAVAIVPFAAARQGGVLRGLTPRTLLWAALAGVFLALHFGFWIASLEYTSVASSVVLVTISPIAVAAASHFLLGDRVGPTVAAGIAVAVVGGVILGVGDSRAGGQELRGDVLALLGALSVVGYLLIGRRQRPRVPLLSYIAIVYAVAAVLLLGAALATRQPLAGYPASTYAWLVLLAFVPQLLGHSLLNAALARVSATMVSVAVMAEPVIATALAVPILGETPPPTSVVGGVLILAGVYLAVRHGQARTSRPPS